MVHEHAKERLSRRKKKEERERDKKQTHTHREGGREGERESYRDISFKEHEKTKVKKLKREERDRLKCYAQE